jgi:drug/metabolite transporter (DMT)-like permease
MPGIVVSIAAISTSAILVRWSGAPSVVKAFYRMLFMTAAVAPFGLRDSDGFLAIGTEAELLGYPPTEWVLFLAMGLLPGMFGHTVINWALKYVESSVVSVSFLGEPVGSTILALALLGEVPAVVTILGAIVVLLGIFVTSRSRAT